MLNPLHPPQRALKSSLRVQAHQHKLLPFQLSHALRTSKLLPIQGPLQRALETCFLPRPLCPKAAREPGVGVEAGGVVGDHLGAHGWMVVEKRLVSTVG